jgi:hypothetical protein
MSPEKRGDVPWGKIGWRGRGSLKIFGRMGGLRILTLNAEVPRQDKKFRGIKGVPPGALTEKKKYFQR